MRYRIIGSMLLIMGLLSPAFARGGNETEAHMPTVSESGADAAVLFGEDSPRVPVGAETIQLLERMGMLPFSNKVPAKPFVRPGLAEETRSLEEFEGSVLLVNFWGSWCAPCREEMPSMQALYEIMAGQPFDMLAINVLESSEVAGAFIEEFDFTFPVALDRDGGLAREFGVRGFPTTYILDEEGYIVAVRAGFHDWSTPAVVEAMQELVARVPAGE
jgi:thiol-disulfide isomerase/thioredoxin